MLTKDRIVPWLVTLVSALVLVLGSVGFAASASASPGNGHRYGQTKAQPHEPATTEKSPETKASAGHRPTSSESGVSLQRPNDYQAQSDPDGMENGGVDQPGGQGGVNTSAQDGNNGSGNDIDCEDDNRGVGVPGHCKDKPTLCQKPVKGNGNAYGHSKACETESAPTTPDTTEQSTVSGLAAPGTKSVTAVVEPAVMGIEMWATATGASPATAPVTAGAPGATGAVVEMPAAVSAGLAGTPSAGALPNTGAGQTLFALILAGLAAAGFGTVLMRRSRSEG